jgi:lysophospholipase L1-like esterase
MESTSTANTGPITYVALGDSTGAGVGAVDGGYPARMHKQLVQLRPESKLINLCVSGATTADVVRNQLDRAMGFDPQLVTLGIGINDIGHGVTLEQFEANLEKILSTLKSNTKTSIVVSNIPDISSAPRIPEALRPQTQMLIVQFNERLEQIANRHGARVFDIFTITHQELAKHPEYFSNDGFHPSDAGYELWAEKMWPTVAQAVK